MLDEALEVRQQSQSIKYFKNIDSSDDIRGKRQTASDGEITKGTCRDDDGGHG